MGIEIADTELLASLWAYWPYVYAMAALCLGGATFELGLRLKQHDARTCAAIGAVSGLCWPIIVLIVLTEAIVLRISGGQSLGD